MRKSREETGHTRKRILAAAKAEFMRNGISDTGVADLMKAAGLTHGGFYRHFPSKAGLVAECAELAAGAFVESLSEGLANRRKSAKMKAIVSGYLSPRHRDNREGCPLVAMGSELARGNDVVRNGATSAVGRILGLIEDQLEGRGRARHRKAVTILSAMVGALALSRMVNDEELSAEFLESTRRHVLQLAPAA